jgi:predicted transcriptional regulator of viral defense system
VNDVETDIQEITTGAEGIILRISNRERTFVDCIDRPYRTGGWKIAFKSLVHLKNVNLDRVIEILEEQNNQMLIRKTGLILELLGHETFHWTPEIVFPYLKRIAKMVKGQMQYMDRRTYDYPNRIRVDPWRLYITELFEAQLREYPFNPIFE